LIDGRVSAVFVAFRWIFQSGSFLVEPIFTTIWSGDRRLTTWIEVSKIRSDIVIRGYAKRDVAFYMDTHEY
jgi:hypothetical protein